LSGARIVQFDLADHRLDGALPDDVDVIVHLAQAYKSFPEFANEIFDINAGSTQRLADWGRRNGIKRFVLASSGSVYAPASKPLREEDAPEPHAYHPLTKLVAEQVLTHYETEMDVVRLRLFAPYGPGQTDRMIPRLISSVAEGHPVTLSRGGEPRLKPIFVDDLVDIIAQAVSGAGAKVVNVAGPTAMSVAEMAETIGRAIGRDPIFQRQDTEPVGDLVADTTRMNETFRVRAMVEPADGLAITSSSIVARA
jgi:nucleoside-diphosphate-sugar epimerase